jgi:hypothetical protein
MILERFQGLINREIVEISDLIKKTPASAKNMGAYHNKIIDRLDSGRILYVPSEPHRQLHQMMWMIGHQICENMKEEDEACLAFVTSPHRERFDIWYAKKYILEKKLNEWELRMVEEASRECLLRYKHPIEEILESEVLE